MFTLSQIMVECVCVCNVLVFTLSQMMVDWVCVCNLRASLLCLHCHRAWLIGYVCVIVLLLYCVYTVTDHG